MGNIRKPHVMVQLDRWIAGAVGRSADVRYSTFRQMFVVFLDSPGDGIEAMGEGGSLTGAVSQALDEARAS